MNKEGVELGEDLIIDMRIKAYRDCDRVDISFDVKDDVYAQVTHISNYDSQFHLLNVKAGKEYNVRCVMKNINLAPRTYTANLWVGSPYEMYDCLIGCVRSDTL